VANILRTCVRLRFSSASQQVMLHTSEHQVVKHIVYFSNRSNAYIVWPTSTSRPSAQCVKVRPFSKRLVGIKASDHRRCRTRSANGRAGRQWTQIEREKVLRAIKSLENLTQCISETTFKAFYPFKDQSPSALAYSPNASLRPSR
jgi:hypothetical protein